MNDNDTARLALIGCGGFSGGIANAIQKSNKAKLITCFDVLPERRNGFIKQYGCHQEENYENVLKRHDIAGVIIATPNSLHADQTVLAAEHGKHVLVQKPISNQVSDARRMIEACKRNGVVLAVAHNQRRLAGFRKIKAMLDRGSLGKIVMVEANFSLSSGFKLTPQAWRWYNDECPGGPMMTLGVHFTDTLQHFFGPFQFVSSFSKRLCISAEIVDAAVAIFEFESGILGYLGSAYVTPFAYSMAVYGTKANAYFNLDLPARTPSTPGHYGDDWNNGDRYSTLFLKTEGTNQQTKVDLECGEILVEEVDEFSDCILARRRPETGGEEGLLALVAILASIRSIESKKPVKMSDILSEH